MNFSLHLSDELRRVVKPRRGEQVKHRLPLETPFEVFAEDPANREAMQRALAKVDKIPAKQWRISRTVGNLAIRGQNSQRRFCKYGRFARAPGSNKMGSCALGLGSCAIGLGSCALGLGLCAIALLLVAYQHSRHRHRRCRGRRCCRCGCHPCGSCRRHPYRSHRSARHLARRGFDQALPAQHPIVSLTFVPTLRLGGAVTGCVLACPWHRLCHQPLQHRTRLCHRPRLRLPLLGFAIGLGIGYTIAICLGLGCATALGSCAIGYTVAMGYAIAID